MSKKLFLAAALLSTLVTASLAVTLPAWAANNEKPQPYTADVPYNAKIHGPERVEPPPSAAGREFTSYTGYAVCAASGTPSYICTMKYMAEDDALHVAQWAFKDCEIFVSEPQCPAILAYIKQRWGH